MNENKVGAGRNWTRTEEMLSLLKTKFGENPILCTYSRTLHSKN